MEMNSKIRTKRITNLIGQAIFFIIASTLLKNITCPFKKIFHIPCPFCGMTRAYQSLLKLKIKESLNYNIIFLPIVILILIIDIISLIEIMTNKRILPKIKPQILTTITIIILLTSMIYNLY